MNTSKHFLIGQLIKFLLSINEIQVNQMFLSIRHGNSTTLYTQQEMLNNESILNRRRFYCHFSLDSYLGKQKTKSFYNLVLYKCVF